MITDFEENFSDDLSTGSLYARENCDFVSIPQSAFNHFARWMHRASKVVKKLVKYEEGDLSFKRLYLRASRLFQASWFKIYKYLMKNCRDTDEQDFEAEGHVRFMYYLARIARYRPRVFRKEYAEYAFEGTANDGDLYYMEDLFEYYDD